MLTEYTERVEGQVGVGKVVQMFWSDLVNDITDVPTAGPNINNTDTDGPNLDETTTQDQTGITLTNSMGANHSPIIQLLYHMERLQYREVSHS